MTRLWVYDFATGTKERLEFDEAVHTVWLGYNPEYDVTRARFGYTSFVTPNSAFELDFLTGERTLLKQQEVVGGHDPSQYVSERLFATAPDGTRVPISLVRRREMAAGPRPLLLSGYGAYGISSDPDFGTNRLSLLDRGLTFAIAHIRGGQELGRAWYEDGKLLHKKHTFSDFIACAEHLVAEGYSAPDRMAAYGGSAGGMLMGVVANERPELFRLIVAEVPFVDVLRVMLDASLPLTTGEYVEWGDPRDPVYYDYIRSYSPYDNVVPQDYPTLFITGGLEDDQVPYWQPAKWTAKLRATKSDDNVLLLRMNMGAGHGGESGFYDAQQELAFNFAFVLSTLGLSEVEPKKTADALATPYATPRASS
jgi:oligopeptidase B